MTTTPSPAETSISSPPELISSQEIDAALLERFGDDFPDAVAAARSRRATADVPAEGDADGGDAEYVEAAPTAPYDRDGRWYVVHSYAGYENKVKTNLASRVRSLAAEDRVFEIIIPMQDVVEFKGGRKVTVQKKIFPGYLLVRMELDDHTWNVVQNTPGVTGFIGTGDRPVALSRREVEDILGKADVAVEPGKTATLAVGLEVGQQVRIVAGPFADFVGAIDSLDLNHDKVVVLVDIFGRETSTSISIAEVIPA